MSLSLESKKYLWSCKKAIILGISDNRYEKRDIYWREIPHFEKSVIRRKVGAYYKYKHKS